MELISSKKIETNRYELEIKVGEEEFSAAVDQAFRKNVRKMTVPGFRKGKAPKAVVYKMYGENVFYEDAVNDLYPKAYADAIEAAGLEPVAYPDVNVESLDKTGFTFKAVVVVKPEVELTQYKGISVEKVVKTVEDSDIDEEIDRMRHRNSRTINVTDRAAKEGDTVIIDFEGSTDGVPFEGGKAEKTPLKLGAGQFIPGFEEQVAGHSIGDEFTIDVTFPEEYHAENLKGKEAQFKIVLHEIKEEELPELDDEFAKDVSEFDTLADLRADLCKKLTEQREKQAETEYENALVDKVVEGMKAEIPVEMVDNQTAELMNDYAYRLQMQGLSMEMFLQYTGQSMEDFKESFRQSADKQVRTRLALEKVAQLENIAPTDEEVDAEYQRMAEMYQNNVERLKSSIPASEVKADLAVKAAVDFIRDNAVAAPAAEAAEEEAPKKRAPRRKKAAEAESEESK